MVSRPNSGIRRPQYRNLRVFAFDPSLNLEHDTASINTLTLSVPWEDVTLGPVGEYLEVVDVDPASDAFYPPIDLNDNYVVVADGLPPSEGTPQFHQQMVYAVSSKTIQNFEVALGRKIHWSAHVDPHDRNGKEQFIKRLRIYPHALRMANAYYSSHKKALLFGYFPATTGDAGNTLPGGVVFTCLSHDIVAHETTHAILDGVHPFFGEPSNLDVLALHEAFADIVALFQRFSHPDIIRQQIASLRGELYDNAENNYLAQLANQFGQATGKRGALRKAIGDPPDPAAFLTTREPHDRGGILVAAVFNAFLTVYKSRVADLIRIATSGTGVLPPGAIHPDLVSRMAMEAAQVAQHVLSMCIRALDYCVPVDPTFGEYLRALITADFNLNPLDPDGYRIAFIVSFRERGIYPDRVRSLSEESLLWDTPESDPVLSKFFQHPERLRQIQEFATAQRSNESGYQKKDDPRRKLNFDAERKFRTTIEQWIGRDLKGEYDRHFRGSPPGQGSDEKTRLVQDSINLVLWPDPSKQSIVAGADGQPRIEVNSARLAYRVESSGRPYSDLVIEINQTRKGYLDPLIQAQADQGHPPAGEPDFIFRGGVTMLIDTDSGQVSYVITKSVDSDRRLAIQRSYLSEPDSTLAFTYFNASRVQYLKSSDDQVELFAMLHASDSLEEDF